MQNNSTNFNEFSCKNLDLICTESLIKFLISTIQFYFLSKAISHTKTDKNKILDKLDKLIMEISQIQIFLSIIYSFFLLKFFNFTIKMLKIFTDTLILLILIYSILKEEFHSIVVTFFMLYSIFISINWFLFAIIDKFSNDFNCISYKKLFFSGNDFIICFFTFIIGFFQIFISKNFAQNYQKKIQISFLIFGGIFASFFQILQDFYAHLNSKSINNCEIYYENYNFDFKKMFLFIFTHLITQILPIFRIYIAFYWINRKNFSNQSIKSEKNDNFEENSENFNIEGNNFDFESD